LLGSKNKRTYEDCDFLEEWKNSQRNFLSNKKFENSNNNSVDQQNIFDQ